MFNQLLIKTEAFIKGLMFDCRTCGQCILKRTGFICPMSCPKGLRNGPCGGTVEGECEVYPDKKCVWVRIHNKTSNRDFSLPDLNASPDANLHHTSSYKNLLTGEDAATRKPLPYLDLGSDRTKAPLQTKSALEKLLKEGAFVKTCEVRSPREGSLGKLKREIVFLKDHFDAVNATAHLGGSPSLPSSRTALEIEKIGVEAIAQVTCRDHTKTTFVSELINNELNELHNLLCLTGDSYVGKPKMKQVFDMDSSLMIYEARHIREKGTVQFNDQDMKNPPRIFLGAVINPFTKPINVPIKRIKQKSAAGADFIQSQLVFDFDSFLEFMEIYQREGLSKDLFFIAGVPVITSKKAFGFMRQIPGMKVPEELVKAVEEADDILAFGLEWARQMIEKLEATPGVNGVHLMLIGSDNSILPDVVSNLKNNKKSIENQNIKEDLCLSKD